MTHPSTNHHEQIPSSHVNLLKEPSQGVLIESDKAKERQSQIELVLLIANGLTIAQETEFYIFSQFLYYPGKRKARCQI